MATPGQTVKTHQAIAQALSDNGVDTLFGLMGDGNMFMCDSFARDCGGTYVAAANEGGTVLMALGYAGASGRVGVASVTHGPGLTNTITPLVQGVKAAVPMVLIAGDTLVEARHSPQKIARREFVVATGAGFEQLRSPRSAVRDVANALRRAVAERRPIVLNVPVDFDFADVEYQPIRVRHPERRATVTESEDLDDAIGMVAAAGRPVIIAGRGATSPEAKAALLRLARRIEAPVATTLKAKDLFRGDDYDLGIAGTESSAVAAEIILESDCLLFFGAGVTNPTTSLGAFTTGKRTIQVNQEPAEIGRNAMPDAGLVGDPAAVADLFVHWLDEAEIPPSGAYTPELKERIAASVDVPAAPADGDGTVDGHDALARLDRMLPVDRLLVTDGGRFMRLVWPVIGVRGPDSSLLTVDFGSIGLGMGHAIGAAYAAKGRPVVLFVGDGALMNFGLLEFNTAVRGKLDLIVVLCNDGSYGAEHVKFTRKGKDPTGSLFDWPDFAPVAVALGGEGCTVRSDADGAAVERAIAERRGPLLIDGKLDPARLSAED